MKTSYKITIAISLLIIGILMMMNNVSAYDPHKQNLVFSLVINSNNGTSCNLSSIQYPDGSLTIFNRPLTKNGQSFSTTIIGTNFTMLGSTCMNVICTDLVTYETGSVCREVSPSGFAGTLGFYFIILILSAGVIILGFWKQDAPIVLLGSFGLYFVGFYVLLYGIDGLRDVTYTWALAIITLALAAYISIRTAYELVVD